MAGKQIVKGGKKIDQGWHKTPTQKPNLGFNGFENYKNQKKDQENLF